MFCTIYRWLISRSMDTPGPLPKRVARHVAACPACRDYHDRCVELARRLVHEAADQSPAVSEELHARILLRCGVGAEAAAPRPMPRLNARRLRIGLAIAAAAAVLMAVMVWQYYPATTPPPDDRIGPGPGPKPRQPIRYAGSDLPIDPQWLVKASSEAGDVIERSIDEPLDQLRQTGRDAAGFVLARLPIDIELP